MIKNIKKIEQDLKVKFKKPELLINALTHKSANSNINNEKLEFLGDRVIGLVLSKKLLDLYPNEKEGVLDKRFAKLVNRETCCKIALSINLNKYIKLGDKKKKIGSLDVKILSDTCEALIGAIFIDSGFSYVNKFVLNVWRLELEKSDITVLDNKTKLQEYALKLFKKLPVYKLVSFTGPKHNPLFKISVSIQGSKIFYGEGNSKQAAQQKSAANLLKSLNIS
tara:strand:- start:441 stop:1109 length:669 start_codon:yes stop_codon:yes gene_type:complete